MKSVLFARWTSTDVWKRWAQQPASERVFTFPVSMALSRMSRVLEC